jgi:hypothetical protein
VKLHCETRWKAVTEKHFFCLFHQVKQFIFSVLLF